MWQGLQTITDYKGKSSYELPSDTSLPDELNAFYAHFGASNTEPCVRAPADPDDCVISLSIADVSRPLNRLIFRLRLQGQTDYQDVYSEHPLTNWQVSVIPTCFKKTTIVPVPKKTKVTCLNDYRAV